MIRRHLMAVLLLATAGQGAAAEQQRQQKPSAVEVRAQAPAKAEMRRAKALPSPTPVTLLKADVLPLALTDDFSFRKQQLFLHDEELEKDSTDRMIEFERMRYNFGAVTAEERRERFGHYFNFWWRSKRPAKLRVRLEYRQAKLGAYVQAKEVDLTVRPGTHKTSFQITGDEYRDDGRVLAWRALLIEEGRIVALSQSFLWH